MLRKATVRHKRHYCHTFASLKANMFRHRGKSRTLAHNLKLASWLSFVAGVVNVSGLFAVQRLTTKVTGHFAFLADEIARKNLDQGVVYLLFIIAFLFGAFFLTCW